MKEIYIRRIDLPINGKINKGTLKCEDGNITFTSGDSRVIQVEKYIETMKISPICNNHMLEFKRLTDEMADDFLVYLNIKVKLFNIITVTK